MRYRALHLRPVRAAAPLLLAVAALTTCRDAPTGPGRVEPRWELAFLSDARDDDPSPRLTMLGGTDSTIRLAVRLPAATRFTAIAWELEVVEPGLSLVSTSPGDLLAGDTAAIAEQVADGDAGHWLGVVTLGSYERELSGPGAVAVVTFRRTRDQPFSARLRFGGGTTLYGAGGAAQPDTVVAGQVVYRRVQGTASR